MAKLENKIRTSLGIATLALIVEACSGARVNSPAAEYATAKIRGEKVECIERADRLYQKGKENNCVYPILTVRF
ncbi:MAG TPA: hypothetical protein VJG30_03555 [Candidatus Nanoarchaeia archaeon]|nr:hypothetical protein [Candidatus Nanoarchaeia archaeon]